MILCNNFIHGKLRLATCYNGERPIYSTQSSQEAEAVAYNYFWSDPGWVAEKQEQGGLQPEVFQTPIQACSSWDKKEAGQGLKRCRSLCGVYLKVTSADRSLQSSEAIQQASVDMANDTPLGCVSVPSLQSPNSPCSCRAPCLYLHPSAAGDISLQPQSPATWEPLCMFLCLCFIFKASKASVAVWFSLMSTIHSHHSFCNTWCLNKDDGWEALFRSVCSHYAGLEKGRRALKAHIRQVAWNHTTPGTIKAAAATLSSSPRRTTLPGNTCQPGTGSSRQNKW